MKCPTCNQGWADYVIFCDVCGTSLKEPVTGEPANEQEIACGQLREMLPSLGIGASHEIEPGHFILIHGSRHLDIQALRFSFGLAVSSVAPMTIGSRYDDGLTRFLIERNCELYRDALIEAQRSGLRWTCNPEFRMRGFPCGRFGVDPLGMVGFTSPIMASSLNPSELAVAINKAMTMADRHDEDVVARSGGTAVRHTSIENVLAPRVLKLFRAGQAGTGIQ